MVTAPILVFPNWSKEFHVHVDVSSIALGAVLEKLGEGDIDHPLAFSSRKLSTAENQLHYKPTRKVNKHMRKVHNYTCNNMAST
jgi:hypothetical protein